MADIRQLQDETEVPSVGETTAPPVVDEELALKNNVSATADAIIDTDLQDSDAQVYHRLAINYMEPEQVNQLFTQGKLSEDNYIRYAAEKEIRDNFWNMDSAVMNYGLDNGLLTERQADLYLSNREHPFLFQAKDLMAGVATGVMKLGQNVGAVIDDTLNSWLPIPQLFGMKWQFEETRDFVNQFEPGTTSGKVAEVLAQFGIPFLGEAKLVTTALKGKRISEVALKSKLGMEIAKKSPKLAKFVAFGLENSVLGMGSDFVAFDPYEPGITEFLDELGVLPEYMDFMRVDEDDPAAMARMKRSFEGALVGLGFGALTDFVFNSVKLMKKKALRKHLGDNDKVAADGLKHDLPNQDIPPKSEADIDKAEKIRLEKAEKELIKEQGGKVDETVSKTPLHPQSSKTVKEAAKAVEFVKMGKDGKMEFEPGVNIDKWHTPDEVISMIKFQANQFAKQIKEVKGKMTQASLSKGAKEIFKQFGDHSPSTVVQFAEEKLGVTGLHGAETFINGLTDYVMTLDKQIIDLIRHGGTDRANELKAQYLMEMSGQIYKYIETASTDAGRLLWSFKRVRETRQSLLNLSKQELDELSGMGGKDKLLKLYADLKDPAMKRRLASKMATGRLQEAILEFTQATLVWGMNTTRVNLVGNTMAMAAKAISQFAGVSAEAMLKLDFGRLSGEFKAYAAGFKEALEDSLRFARGEKQGKVWKAWRTGEAQLDASAKFEGQNLHVLKHYAHEGAKKLGIADKGFNLADAYTISFKNLTAQDELFKNLNYYTQKHSAIFREAYEQSGGKGGEKLRLQIVDKLNKNLPDSIHRESWENARRNTYTMTPSKLSRKMLDLTNMGTELQFGKKVYSVKPAYWLRIAAMPFVNIADNLIRFAGRHTALNIVSKEFQNAMQAGGARRMEAIARASSGTSLFILGYNAHDSGRITANVPVGERGKSMYQNWKARNITPYSFIDKTDRRITSYAKFAPAALIYAYGANLSQMVDSFNMRKELDLETEHLFSKIMMPALFDPILEQHYLKSLQDIFDVVARSERTDMKKAFINQVPKFMPFSMLITQARDDLIAFGWSKDQANAWFTEVNSGFDKIKQIYGVGDLLPKRHFIYGTKISKIEKTLGANVVGAPQRKTDAFEEGTVEHEMGVTRLSVGNLPTKISFTEWANPIRLEPEHMDEIGQNLEELNVKGKLEELIKSPNYYTIPAHTKRGREMRRKMLSEMIAGYRELAIGKFKTAHPEMLEKTLEQVNRDQREYDKARNTIIDKNKLKELSE